MAPGKDLPGIVPKPLSEERQVSAVLPPLVTFVPFVVKHKVTTPHVAPVSGLIRVNAGPNTLMDHATETDQGMIAEEAHFWIGRQLGARSQPDVVTDSSEIHQVVAKPRQVARAELLVRVDVE